MQICNEKIWLPYIENYNGKSMLLLDDFKCHTQPAFRAKLEGKNTIPSYILPGCTSVLQPCDVRVNKPLKDRLKNRAHEWRKTQFATHVPGTPSPSPTRVRIAKWLHEIWGEFPGEIVKNAFRGCGYEYQQGVDYSYDTESDTDESDIE